MAIPYDESVTPEKGLYVLDEQTESAIEHHPLIDEYLQCLIAPLVPVVNYEKRMEFVEEAHEHIEELIQTLIARGENLEEAVPKALKLYGDPRVISHQFSESWFQTRNKSYLARRFGLANLIAFFWIQCVVVAYIVLLEVRIFLPSQSPFQIPFSPAQVREVWPKPLPYPEFTWSFILMMGFPLVAPIIAGFLTGRFVPVSAARAFYNGMSMLIIWSFFMGAMMLPMTEGLLFALFEVVFWLPVGCLTAHLSSLLANSSRCKPMTRSSKSLG